MPALLPNQLYEVSAWVYPQNGDGESLLRKMGPPRARNSCANTARMENEGCQVPFEAPEIEIIRNGRCVYLDSRV